MVAAHRQTNVGNDSKQNSTIIIQANIYAVAKIIFPSQDIVKEHPSINHIKKLLTSIYIIAKTLSAFQLGSAEELKQMHSDETRRRQVSLLNLLIGLIPKTKKLKAICLDLGLLAKDGTAAE